MSERATTTNFSKLSELQINLKGALADQGGRKR